MHEAFIYSLRFKVSGFRIGLKLAMLIRGWRAQGRRAQGRRAQGWRAQGWRAQGWRVREFLVLFVVLFSITTACRLSI